MRTGVHVRERTMQQRISNKAPHMERTPGFHSIILSVPPDHSYPTCNSGGSPPPVKKDLATSRLSWSDMSIPRWRWVGSVSGKHNSAKKKSSRFLEVIAATEMNAITKRRLGLSRSSTATVSRPRNRGLHLVCFACRPGTIYSNLFLLSVPITRTRGYVRGVRVKGLSFKMETVTEHFVFGPRLMLGSSDRFKFSPNQLSSTT